MRRPIITTTILTLLSLLTILPAHTETAPIAGQKICLDPGHGGSALGAVNEAYGLEEKDINLDVAYGLKALPEAGGAQVVMSRTDDAGKSRRIPATSPLSVWTVSPWACSSRATCRPA